MSQKLQFENLTDEVRNEVNAAKLEFGEMLVTQEKLVKRIGDALHKQFADKPEVICGHIKFLLREEIEREAITARRIEQICPDEWKNPTKMKAGEQGGRASAEKISSKAPKMPITINVAGGQNTDPEVKRQVEELSGQFKQMQSKLDTFLNIVDQVESEVVYENDYAKVPKDTFTKLIHAGHQVRDQPTD